MMGLDERIRAVEKERDHYKERARIEGNTVRVQEKELQKLKSHGETLDRQILMEMEAHQETIRQWCEMTDKLRERVEASEARRKGL